MPCTNQSAGMLTRVVCLSIGPRRGLGAAAAPLLDTEKWHGQEEECARERETSNHDRS